MAHLTVAMNGVDVGVLTLSRSGAMSFQYHEHWYNRPGARAISLSLPLSTKRYDGNRVFNFFNNLLPDSDTIRARIQARFHINSDHPFDLLHQIGKDCIGAIQLYPDHEMPASVQHTEAEPLTNSDIALLLRNYQHAPLGMDSDSDFRISLAGAQEKTALLWWKNQWMLPRGSTPTSHILKLPIGFLEPHNIDLRQSNENEWLCLQILKGFGLPVAPAELGHFESQGVLIVERFDRRWSQDQSWLMRLPQEDFCQALGVSPALKYENDGGPGIAEGMKLLQGSQQAATDQERFFKLQILFWMLAAIDGHAKNFSLFLEPSSTYRMTPGYDVLSAFPLMRAGSLPAPKAKMAMSLKSKHRHYHWRRIEPRHFLSTAKWVGFSEQRALALLAECALQTPLVIEACQAALPKQFPEVIASSIFEGLNRQSQAIQSSGVLR